MLLLMRVSGGVRVGVFGVRAVSKCAKAGQSHGVQGYHPAPPHHLNTAAIDFTPNVVLTRRPLGGNIVGRLRCTDDGELQTAAAAPAGANPFNVQSVQHARRTRPIDTTSPGVSLAKLAMPYYQLTKPRLTTLVMLSAICSYALSPQAASLGQLICLTTGTLLTSGAANAINMGREPDFDRQMLRTQARPVVRGLVSPKQAYAFSCLIGLAGTATLYYGVNPTVALLAAANIPLYAWLYTSLKRVSIVNTWVGALVGAIPPLMGWAAASSLEDPAAWCLAALLYCWQFPHFNALSHSVRMQYRNAGYRMTAWVNPRLNARVALRYALLMFPICAMLAYLGVTDKYYVWDSAVPNAWLAYWCFKFYWQQRRNYSADVLGDRNKFTAGVQLANTYARRTMLASVLQLPAVFLLAILHKRGRWDFLWSRDDRPMKP
ncbi:protoheme IX farnesyltransferase KNAG_0J01930 [Huiozyma naganishii CBS 8797]|uniref:Protoheme IX farnesyltransferase, mitochondrial n=1 Tax=Huiozyma naganishii (strain ATCC MYA-139 / BCRC 22969 / CBS 8797 / KCTC 17520 / NBRC 10181 / NCYC 3082 / Yp74L-3) TaxID=1071383 RepID=J7S9S5_HUIN7|nr:hypothetical protein KNAG_0J01930 [Kazachstania naganishii CBS 8797]CCK72274.1 hypothetical protein KNAG_0J01930 [Kazachstania naganishii CBS 8797]